MLSFVECKCKYIYTQFTKEKKRISEMNTIYVPAALIAIIITKSIKDILNSVKWTPKCVLTPIALWTRRLKSNFKGIYVCSWTLWSVSLILLSEDIIWSVYITISVSITAWANMIQNLILYFRILSMQLNTQCTLRSVYSNNNFK